MRRGRKKRIGGMGRGRIESKEDSDENERNR
jgi:hypothetical protein